MIINKTTHEITYTGTYYYLAHFSKFVRPGAIRVQTTGRAQGLRVMSFLTPDGGIVAQVFEQQPVRCSDKFAAPVSYTHLTLPTN